jgi:TPR repeat protein
MSTEADNNSEETNEVCANCGKAEVDEENLKKCACNVVKYCSVDCQKNHRSQHKKACKKRMAEIHDDRLFRQPDGSNLGECPICCLPLPLDLSKSPVYTCCCKLICNGCDHSNQRRQLEQAQHSKSPWVEQRCPYCREPMPQTKEEADQNYMKRIEANDPLALCQVGKDRYNEGDHKGAIQYFTKAAELGHIDAHYQLSCLYDKGEGVERDFAKEVHHLEEAAIGGHPGARYNLGCYEARDGRYDRAMKHFLIAAKLGYDGALDKLKIGFTHGFVSKEEYAAALRGHQAAVDATKSEQREKAEMARQLGLY